MDFSTVDRALASLSRRRPPLPPEVLEISERLSDLLASSCCESKEGGGSPSDNAEYVRGILRLVDLGGGGGSTATATATTTAAANNGRSIVLFRWEPLAVGLRLLVGYLEKRTGELPAPPPDDEGEDYEDEGTGLGTGGGGVYAEGPRIPRIHPADPSKVEANGIAGATADVNASCLTNDETRCRPPHANSPVFELMAALPAIVDANVDHAEPRVRSLVAQVVGVYALYATSLLNWLDSIGSVEVENKNGEKRHQQNQQQKHQLESAIRLAQSRRRAVHSAILLSLKSHLEMTEPSRDENPSAASDGALDDTTGWRALETNLHALASYVDGCVGRGDGSDVGGGGGAAGEGACSGSYVDEELRLFLPSDDECGWFLTGLEHCCVVHVNRHVRAAGAAVLGVLVKSCMRSSRGPSHRDLLVDETSLFRSVLKNSLRSTLEDNWSQVRMAGSVLCRRFVRALLRIHREEDGGEEDGDDDDEGEQDEEELTEFESAVDEDLVPMLLPRMCLNRFYLAQGVKLYGQDTWRIVFGAGGSGGGGVQQNGHSPDELPSSEEARGGGGMGAVARCAAPLCRYYSKMCDADNHAVREAACQGVAELAQKVGTHPLYAEYLSPYVTVLLQALLMCFHDESWPVRDEACLACGTFCLAYPDECLPELPILFDRWTEQLTDQIWSVREDAAVALGDAVVAYGFSMLEKILVVLRKSLPAARDQPPMTRAEYKRLQNDTAAHTGNQLYSCGSLAPKLKKGPAPGAGRIGCSSCVVDRPKAPWEATDGCIYLLRELCVRFADRDATQRNDVIMEDSVLLPLMTELGDVCRLSHYPQGDDLRTTLWRQLPPIAEALGKRRFKGLYLDLFIESLARNLDHQHGGASQLSVHAAGQCAEEIADLIGVGIFRGRLEATGRGEDAFDRVIEERRREKNAAAMGGGRFAGREIFHSPFGPPVAGPA